MTVSWLRDVPGRGHVDYGMTTNLGNRVAGPDCLVRHAITLRDLAPGQTYYYRVSSTDGYTSGLGSFRTAPDGPDHTFRAAVVADTQQFVESGPPFVFAPSTNHARVVAAMLDRSPDFFLHAGDLVFDNDWFLWEDWFAVEAPLLARTPIMPALGNHEVFTVPHDGTHYWNLFTVPQEPGDGRYYSYRYGPAFFIALNTENDPAGQNGFLARSLQQAVHDPSIRWIIVYWHRTIYTWTDKHGRFMPAYDNWVPIISRYGADLVFSGHNHLYERSGPNRGVYYITTGGGGGNPTNPQNVPGGVVSTTAYHFVELDGDGESLDVRAWRWDGQLLDSLSLTQRPRVVRVDPAFPLPGQTARIAYDATQGPLAGSAEITAHVGTDDFLSAFTNVAMHWDATSGVYVAQCAVPSSATQRLAFAFFNESNVWHSNHSFGSPSAPLNWQSLLGRLEVIPAVAQAGQTVTVIYYPELGPLAGATALVVRSHGFVAGRRVGSWDTALTHSPQPGQRSAEVLLPSYVEAVAVEVVDGGGGVDTHDGLGWRFAVTNATEAPPFDIVPAARFGSPEVSDDPETGQNHPGDNMDLVLGGAVQARDRSLGFGDFGLVYVNVDATNLYLGAIGNDLGGSNNVVVVFLGLNTLTDDADVLWAKSGPPLALDLLHNLVFTDPMDIAIVLGDEFGDGAAFTNFTYGGYNFGQGVYYLGGGATFASVPGARLSQFDGVGQVAVTGEDDDGNRRTTRWEVSIPWTSLNATAGVASVDCLLLAGVIGSSSVTGNDRYLSAVYLGAEAYGGRDAFGRFGYNLVTLTPEVIAMPGASWLGDGIPNAWRMERFGSVTGPAAGDDEDGDGYRLLEEYLAGSDPLDPESFLRAGISGDEVPLVVRWVGEVDRAYEVYFQPLDATLPPSLVHSQAMASAGWRSVTVTPPAVSGRFFLRTGP
jgi:hypothetical protein